MTLAQRLLERMGDRAATLVPNTLRDITGDVDPTTLMVASLGHPYEAIERLLHHSAFDLLTPQEHSQITTALRVSDLSPATIAANRDEVARQLGLWGGVSKRQSALPAEAAAAYPLFAHQREALRQARDRLEHQQRCLLHMPTGSGKTRTAMNIVAEHLRENEGTQVVWLADSGVLCQQAAEEFTEAWGHLGNRKVELRAAWGSRPVDWDTAFDGLLVGTPQTLDILQSRDGATVDAVAGRTSLVVFDEAHRSLAPTWNTVTLRLCTAGAHLLGLSATPGRTTLGADEDTALAQMYKRQKVTLNTAMHGVDNAVEYLIQEGYLARPEFRTLTVDGLDGHIDPDGEPDIIGITEYGRLVIDAVDQLIAEGHRRLIVFTSSVRTSDLIAAALRTRNRDAQSLHGATPGPMRQAMIDRYRSTSSHPMVLVNYGVIATGFDAPTTSAAIIARPVRSLVLYSQMIGRAIRGPRAGGRPEGTATIVGLMDTTDTAFEDVSEAFLNWEDIW